MKRKFNGLLISGTVTMMVVTILMMSDTLIAGATLGKAAVEGINLVTPVYSLAAFFGSIFATGVPILYNGEMGKFNKKGADKVFGLGLTMTTAIGVILFAVLMIFGDIYLDFYKTTNEVFEFSKDYFFWYKFTILILPLSMLMSEMVFADGDETLSTAAGLAQFFGNIAISLLLCKPFGTAGIGFGSFVGTILSIAVSSLHFLRKSNSLKMNFYLSGKMIFSVVKYSIVDAGTYLFIALLAAVLNKFVTAAYGENMLILVSVVMLIKELQVLFDGIGSAMTPITTIYLSENSFGGVKKMWALAKKTAIIEGIAMTVIGALLIAPLLPYVFGVTDAVTAGYVAGSMAVISVGFTFTSLIFLASSYYLLIDKIPLAFVMCALRDVIFAVPLAIAMGSAFGIYGMFAGLAIASVAAYGITMLYIRRKYGKDNYPLLIKEKEDAVLSFFYEITIEPESIIVLQAEIDGELEKNGIDKQIIGMIKLLVEDLYMLIYEKNGKKPVLGECTMIIDNGVSLITKDDGVLFNLAEEDAAAGTIGEYLISNYMRTLPVKQHLVTMSYNRNVFKIRTKENV